MKAAPPPRLLRLNELPFHITVEKKRKAIDVLSWGGAPFAVDEHCNIIPNGFRVRTYYKGQWFVATVRVLPAAANRSQAANANHPDMQEEYQFTCESSQPKCTGQWSVTPSGALQNVVDELGSKISCSRGSNGALQVGVIYPNVQHAIREVFRMEEEEVSRQDEETEEEEEEEEQGVLQPSAMEVPTATSPLSKPSSASTASAALHSSSSSTNEKKLPQRKKLKCEVRPTPQHGQPSSLLLSQSRGQEEEEEEDDDNDTALLLLPEWEDGSSSLLGADEPCDWADFDLE